MLWPADCLTLHCLYSRLHRADPTIVSSSANFKFENRKFLFPKQVKPQTFTFSPAPFSQISPSCCHCLKNSVTPKLSLGSGCCVVSGIVLFGSFSCFKSTLHDCRAELCQMWIVIVLNVVEWKYKTDEGNKLEEPDSQVVHKLYHNCTRWQLNSFCFVFVSFLWDSYGATIRKLKKTTFSFHHVLLFVCCKWEVTFTSCFWNRSYVSPWKTTISHLHSTQFCLNLVPEHCLNRKVIQGFSGIWSSKSSQTSENMPQREQKSYKREL